MLYYICKGWEGLICRLSFPGNLPLWKIFQKTQKNFLKPLDKVHKVCYTISVNRRGHDRLPLTLSLKVYSLSPVVSFPIGPSRRVCLLITSFLWHRVGGAPDCHDGVHGGFLSWRRGERLRPENTHTLTKRSDAWQLGQTGTLQWWVHLMVRIQLFHGWYIGSTPVLTTNLRLKHVV